MRLHQSDLDELVRLHQSDRDELVRLQQNMASIINEKVAMAKLETIREDEKEKSKITERYHSMEETKKKLEEKISVDKAHMANLERIATELRMGTGVRGEYCGD